jgi:hypothetical protein
LKKVFILRLRQEIYKLSMSIVVPECKSAQIHPPSDTHSDGSMSKGQMSKNKVAWGYYLKNRRE